MASYSFQTFLDLETDTTTSGSINVPLTLTAVNGTSVASTDKPELVVGNQVTFSLGGGGTINYVYLGTWTSGGQTWPILQQEGTTNSYVIFSNTEYPSPTTGTETSNSFVTCLLGGTLIEAPGGSVKVEDLSIGDVVSTSTGTASVRFIGRCMRTLFQLRASGRMPVCIDAGALGVLGPKQEILCTPSHAFYIKGCLVEAQALINGTSIRQLESWEDPIITVYSIELEHHDLVWANGLLTETYFPSFRGKHVSREAWDNYADYQALYGEGNVMSELPHPRIPFQRQVPAEIRGLIPSAAVSSADDSAYTLM